MSSPGNRQGTHARRLRFGALSLLATTGLFGTYLGYPGLRRAYAAPASCTVTSNGDDDSAPFTPGELRYCLDEIDTSGGGTIAFDPSIGVITLRDDLPQVALTSSLTIIGAGEEDTVIDGDTDYSAFYFTGAQPVSISGLTVRDTYSATNAAGLVTRHDATLTNVTFTNNVADDGEGGAVDALGSIIITDSTFTSNSADGDGGAVHAFRAATVTGSTFTGNDSRIDGGALAAGESSTISNSEFQGNSANDDGGALSFRQSSTVSGSSFTSNTTVDYGGAIFTSATTVTVNGSFFVGNSADFGGALYTKYGAAIEASTFTANVADSWGGAIFGSYPPAAATLTVTNTTLTANEAYGCAAICWYGDAEINFVTNASNPGSATTPIYAANYVKGDLRLTNSVFYGNTYTNGTTLDLDVRGTLTANHSLVTSRSTFSGSSEALTNLIYGDPRLGPLTDNGGPTLTMMPAADSPVIGMGDPTGAPAFDQRGYTRTTNGYADMGSVERGGRRPAPDPSQMPPTWFQATTRNEQTGQCPANMHPSWAEWPNNHTGGWTCEWSTWWDINKGNQGGWATTPGFNPGRPVNQ